MKLYNLKFFTVLTNKRQEENFKKKRVSKKIQLYFPPSTKSFGASAV